LGHGVVVVTVLAKEGPMQEIPPAEKKGHHRQVTLHYPRLQNSRRLQAVEKKRPWSEGTQAD